MTGTTITSYHKIIADYIDWFQKKTPILFEPAVQLKALDIYSMRQIVDFLPEAPYVIDMGSEASFGLSRLMWLHHYNLRQFATISISSSIPNPQWYHLLNQYIEKMKYTEHVTIYDIQAIDNLPIVSLSDYMVCLLVGDVDTQTEAINAIYSVYPDAIIFMLPLHKLHHKETRQLLRTIDNLDKLYQLTALRDWSPFFSGSDLGILYPQDNDVIDSVLTRLAQLYKGNHDFLPLLKLQIDSQVASMSEKIIQLDEALNQQKVEQGLTSQTHLPEPSASGRFFQRIFRQNLSPSHIPEFRTSQKSSLKKIRESYHKIIPLKVRLSLRNLRVRIFGF